MGSWENVTSIKLYHSALGAALRYIKVMIQVGLTVIWVIRLNEIQDSCKYNEIINEQALQDQYEIRVSELKRHAHV